MADTDSDNDEPMPGVLGVAMVPPDPTFDPVFMHDVQEMFPRASLLLPLQDEGDSNAGVAIAAVSVIHIFLYGMLNNANVRLSPRQIYDVFYERRGFLPDNFSLNVEETLSYINFQGLLDEGDYPWHVFPPVAPVILPHHGTFCHVKFKRFPTNEIMLKLDIGTPVMALLRKNVDYLSWVASGSNGVFRYNIVCNGYHGNMMHAFHAVSIVGYGSHNDEPFYLVQDSNRAVHNDGFKKIHGSVFESYSYIPREFDPEDADEHMFRHHGNLLAVGQPIPPLVDTDSD